LEKQSLQSTQKLLTVLTSEDTLQITRPKKTHSL
jgi:hypothetical protein